MGFLKHINMMGQDEIRKVVDEILEHNKLVPQLQEYYNTSKKNKKELANEKYPNEGTETLARLMAFRDIIEADRNYQIIFSIRFKIF